jgi:hypothetical protein
MLWFAHVVRQLQAELSADTIALERRNARVQALQKRWDYLRAGLDLVLDQRGADMAEVPGGASGFPPKNQPGENRDALGFGKVSVRLLAPTSR